MIIRPAAPADAPGVQAIYAPIVESTVISFELEPPSLDEISHRIEAYRPWHGAGSVQLRAGDFASCEPIAGTRAAAIS